METNIVSVERIKEYTAIDGEVSKYVASTILQYLMILKNSIL